MKHIAVLIFLIVKTISADTRRNVALGGEATQIDTYDERGAASNAIDGNRDSNYFHKSCTATAETTNPWWRVDLRDTYNITSIVVINRGDCCAQRINGAQIRVGNSLLNNGNNNPVVATIAQIPAGRSKTFNLPKHPEGRYVNVFLPRTGKHLTLCEVEVYGYKHKENNVALGGEATQIDTWDWQGDASNAIDGNHDSNYFHDSCTATAGSANPWWRLDLRDTYFITSIVVTNRGDCCADRLNGAQIRVGNSLLNNGNNNSLVATIARIPAGHSKTFILAEHAKGRYVNVFLPGKGNYLTLCEVEVYGYQDADNNLALSGEATQIDTWDGLGAASNAIDGNRDSIYSHKSCSHTRTTTNPWWRVDLRDTFAVTSVTIKNRGDCCAQRLDGAQIRVGSSLQNNGNDNPVVATVSHIPLGLSHTFKMSEPVEGRYVNVYLPGTNKYLTLCEVEVYGNEVYKGESPDTSK